MLLKIEIFTWQTLTRERAHVQLKALKPRSVGGVYVCL